MASLIEQYRAQFGSSTQESAIQRYRDTLKAKEEATSAVSEYRKIFTNDTIGKADLDTTRGLYQLAKDRGLQKDADKILQSQAGEKPKGYFSGGFISDIFDTLNTLQYGVTGLIKGKGFLEGIKTRQSFADDDALGDFGIPGMIAGIVLDIAVDPLTYVAPWTIAKKIPGLAKGAKAISTAAKETKIGEALGQKFVWMFGADPIFKKTYEKMLKNVGIETQKIVDLSKGVADISPGTAAKILTRDEVGRFVRTPIEQLTESLSKEELQNVSTLYNKLDSLGREAVDLKLLPADTFEENIGKYIKNAYEEYELGKKSTVFGRIKAGIKGIKPRKQVENVAELGVKQIDNPAYLLFKSNVDLIRDIENAKMFRVVNKNLASEVAKDGFVKLPNAERWGELSGKFVPENVDKYLREIIPADDKFAKAVQKAAVNNFKFFKVIMNPATHARNMVSNQILNWWKLGMNPLDPRAIKSNAIATSEIFKKGGKWTKEAKELGYSIDTFAAAEMKGLLEAPEIASVGNKMGNAWSKLKGKLGDLYQSEENLAKLSAYIFNRTAKKLEPEDAWKLAEAATFNYAQVTPFIRRVRESLFGVPFITFAVKATPLAAETAVKYPRRISAIGKIKNAIEQQADIKKTEAERAAEPQWVKEGFYVKLWDEKSRDGKPGRSQYLDLTYILPFGDILAGNFFERRVNHETGIKETLPQTAFRKLAFINVVAEIAANEDFYGNKIWRETDSQAEKTRDLLYYLARAYGPPLIGDQIPGGYNSKGERQQRGFVGASTPVEELGTRRNMAQELLRNVGAKIQPMDAELNQQHQDWNTQRALKTLLTENGILNELNINYTSK